jgi:hypothetical protein
MWTFLIATWHTVAFAIRVTTPQLRLEQRLDYEADLDNLLKRSKHSKRDQLVEELRKRVASFLLNWALFVRLKASEALNLYRQRFAAAAHALEKTGHAPADRVQARHFCLRLRMRRYSS